MSIRVLKSNIFTTRCQTIVNTINCEGVMGAGIALEFRLRYPDMYRKYVDLCASGSIRPGILWLYRAQDRLVLNFPTKDKWRFPSRPEYLELGLRKFAATYREKGITSIAFPLLGADKGGLDKEVSIGIMRRHLEGLEDLEVEIYEYSRKAHDDLYLELQKVLLNTPIGELVRQTGVSKGRLETIRAAMETGNVYQISQLGLLRGIGPDTLEKLFRIRGSEVEQQRLDL